MLAVLPHHELQYLHGVLNQSSYLLLPTSFCLVAVIQLNGLTNQLTQEMLNSLRLHFFPVR